MGNYLKGLSGLSAKDRQSWEKANLDKIMKHDNSASYKNQLYLNQQFKKTFGDQSNYEQLKSLSKYERNALLEQYNRDIAFKNRFSTDTDLLNSLGTTYEDLLKLPNEQRNALQDKVDLRDDVFKKYGNDPNIHQITSWEDETIKEFMASNWLTDAQLNSLNKKTLDNANRKVKEVARSKGGFADALLEGLAAQSGMSTMDFNYDRQKSYKEEAQQTNKQRTDKNNELFESFVKKDIERKKQLTAYQDEYNTQLKATQKLLNSKNGSALFRKLVNDELMGDSISPGSAYYKAFKENKGGWGDWENWNWNNVGVTTAAGTATGLSTGSMVGRPLVGTGIGATVGFSSGVIGETFGAKPSIDKMSDTELMKYYASYKAMEALFGKSTALTSIDNSIKEYIQEKQNIADAQENTMRNIWVGGVANTANKYFAVRNMQKFMTDNKQAPYYLQGLRAVEDENGNFKRDENGKVITEELPWYDNPKYFADAEQANTFDVNTINTFRETGGLSKYNIIRDNEWSIGGITDNSLRMLKFAWSDYLFNSLLSVPSKGLAALRGAKFVDKAGNASSIFNVNSTIADAAGKGSSLYSFTSGLQNAAMSLGIAESYGMQTFDSVRGTLNQKIDAKQDKIRDNLFEQYMADADKNEQAIQKKTQELINNYLKKHPGERNSIIPETFRRLAEKQYQEAMFSLATKQAASQVQGEREAADVAALAGYVSDATLEEGFMYLASKYTPRKMFLDKGARKQLNLTQSTLQIQRNGNHFSVAGKGANFWKTLGFSFLGGAETNFHDDARVNFGEGFGFSYFNNKLKDKYNLGIAVNNGTDFISDKYNSIGIVNNSMDFFGNLIDGLYYTKEHYFDSQHFYDGLIGGLGGIFNVQINPNALTKKGRGTSFRTDSEGRRLSPSETIAKYIQNPVLQEYLEERHADQQQREVAMSLNTAVEKNKDNLLKANILINSLRAMSKDNNEENSSLLNILDNKQKAAFALSSVIKDFSENPYLRETDLFKELQDNINKYSNLESLSNEEKQEIVSQYLALPDNVSEQRAYMNLSDAEKQNANQEILNKITENVQYITSVMDSYNDKVIGLKRNFPHLSNDAIQQIAYMQVNKELWQNRLNDIESQLTGTEVTDNTSILAKFNDKKGFEYYKKGIETTREELKKEIEDIDTQINKEIQKVQQQGESNESTTKISALELKKENTQRTLDRINDSANELQDIEKELEGNYKKVLSAEEIMSLSPIDRAIMLNPSNLWRYSKAQQKIIKDLTEAKKKDNPDFINQVMDSRTLIERIQNADNSISIMKEHPEELEQYIQSVKMAEFLNTNNAIRAYNIKRVQSNLSKMRKYCKDNNMNVRDEDIVKDVFKNEDTQTIKDFIKAVPKYEGLLKDILDASVLRKDITNVINSKFADPTQRQLLHGNLYELLKDQTTAQDIIDTLEDLVDNTPDDINREAFDTILKGLEELNYSRNATKVQNRKQNQAMPQMQIVDAEAEAAAAVIFDPANTLISEEDKQVDPSKMVMSEDMGTIIEGNQEKKAKRYSITPGITISRDTANSQLEGSYTEHVSDDYVNKREQKRIQATIDYLNGDITNAKDYLIELGYAHGTENAWLDSATTEEIQKAADKKANIYKSFITDNEAESKSQQPTTIEGVTPIPTEEMMADAILEDINFDEETGQAVTPTIQLDPNKDDKVITCALNEYSNEETISIDNTSSAPTLPGNFFKGWDYNTLEQDGKQVEAVSQATNKQAQMQDAAFRQWLKDNNIHLQDIVDEELGYIIQQFPDTEIRFMFTKPKSMNKWEDMMIENQILVIEYSGKIKKSGIHNDKNGGIISANGKEWLVVGSLGFDGKNHASIQAKNTTINSDMLRRRMNYFNTSPLENYYVDTVAHTQVSKMTNGRLTLQLVNQDSIEVRPITDLIGDGKPSATNPDGVSIESLAWGIQTNDAFKPIGLMPGEEVNILPPVKTSDNVGRAFVLIPSSDGKHYIPANIRPTMWGELKDGDLKQSIIEVLMEVSAPNLSTRQSGIKKLCKIFHMPKDGGPTILVGSQKYPNSLTVIGQNGVVLGQFIVDQNFNRLNFLRTIEQANFRININESVLSTPSEVRRYAEAGALNTDLAKLRPSGAIFNVYPCDQNGNPIIGETVHYNSSVPGSDLQRVQRFEYSTILLGKTYRYRDGKFQDEQGREVTNAAMLDNLYYNKQLDDANIPVANTIVIKGKAIEQYILNDSDNPLVYNRDTKTKQITVLKGDEALKVISNIKAQAEAKERAKQATHVVELEDVILGDEPVQDVIITNDQAPAPQDITAEPTTPTPAPQPAPAPPAITTEQMNQQMIGNFTTEAPAAPAPIQAPAPVPVPSNENSVKETQNVNEVGNNSLINLDNQEKSSTFVDVMVQHKEVRKRLKDVFTKKGLPFGKPADVQRILQDMGVPVSGITDIEKWISNIENCK